MPQNRQTIESKNESIISNFSSIMNDGMNNIATSRKRCRIEESFSALSIDADMINTAMSTEGSVSYTTSNRGYRDNGLRSYSSSSSNKNVFAGNNRTMNREQLQKSLSDELSSASDESENELSAEKREALYKLAFGKSYRSGKSRRVGYESPSSNRDRVDDRIEQIIRASRHKAESYENGGMNYDKITHRQDVLPNREPDSPRFSGMQTHSEFMLSPNDDEFVEDGLDFCRNLTKINSNDARNKHFLSKGIRNEKWSNTSLYSLASDEDMDFT